MIYVLQETCQEQILIPTGEIKWKKKGAGHKISNNIYQIIVLKLSCHRPYVGTVRDTSSRMFPTSNVGVEHRRKSTNSRKACF
jgi:hypothetical protein